MSASVQSFRERYKRAVRDPDLKPRLLAFQRSWRHSRDAQIQRLEQRTERPFEDLRQEFAATKDRVRASWDDYISEFRSNAEAAGATVVELDSAAEAVEYITSICQSRGIDLVVKSKSMVSEEIDLNDALERRGITAVETDLGEWLLQLAEERPSHLVMPAIHQKRQYVAQILGGELGTHFDPDDIPAMVASARDGLRKHYLQSGAGLTGANALVADTGSIMVVTNEGNMRLATSLPDVHFVTAGIEKIVPTWSDAHDQLQLLPRSATAQQISTYTTCMTGPQPGKEMHIILLDNGRRDMHADDGIADALRCIRCGACANVCPPYQVVGGHAFGHIYTGAIGLVNTTFHHSIEDAAGPQGLCVSCGACETVCPVAIPLQQQILHVRRRAFDAGHSPRWERLALNIWSKPTVMRTAMGIAALLSSAARGLGLVQRAHVRLPLPSRLRWRSIPVIPLRSGQTLIASRQPQTPIASSPAAGLTVDLFVQCLADRLMPQAVDATARLVEAGGATVQVPGGQHCCGLPAFDAGDWDTSRIMARQTIESMEQHTHPIVTPAASCVIAMQDHWPQLFADDPDWLRRAQSVSDRIYDLAAWLDGPGRLPNHSLQSTSQLWAAHRFCQTANRGAPEARIDQLVARLTDSEPAELAEADVCCGFGGLTSLAAPEVGAGILQRKLDCVNATECDILLTNNPGCAIHLNAGAHAWGDAHETMHYAEFLANLLPNDGA